MKKKFLITLLIFLSMPASDRVYAYADPGVGGTLYQIVVLILSGIGFFFLSLKMKVFRFFGKRRKGKS